MSKPLHERLTPEKNKFFRPEAQQWPATLFARKLEQQRDEAREQLIEKDAQIMVLREIVEVVEASMRKNYNLPSYLHNKCVEALANTLP